MSPRLVHDTRGKEGWTLLGVAERSLRVLLPDALNSVLLKNRIGRDDGHTFLPGLRGKQPIEWIAVMKGKPANVRNVPKVNRENRETVCSHLLRDEAIDGLRDFEFAQALLDRDLPAGGHAQEALIA